MSDLAGAVTVRPESEADAVAIAGVLSAAFRRVEGGEVAEVALVEDLRRSASWLPEFALVAEVGGRVVGYCLATRASVGGTAALALGPVAVSPHMQGRGVGSLLMDNVLLEARNRGEGVVGLLGDPAFYSRFGFVPATDTEVRSPDPRWGEHFQVLLLGHTELEGTFVYAPEFGVD